MSIDEAIGLPIETLVARKDEIAFSLDERDKILEILADSKTSDNQRYAVSLALRNLMT